MKVEILPVRADLRREETEVAGFNCHEKRCLLYALVHAWPLGRGRPWKWVEVVGYDHLFKGFANLLSREEEEKAKKKIFFKESRNKIENQQKKRGAN